VNLVAKKAWVAAFLPLALYASQHHGYNNQHSASEHLAAELSPAHCLATPHTLIHHAP
jgi:hypothetical protein